MRCLNQGKETSELFRQEANPLKFENPACVLKPQSRALRALAFRWSLYPEILFFISSCYLDILLLTLRLTIVIRLQLNLHRQLSSSDIGGGPPTGCN